MDRYMTAGPTAATAAAADNAISQIWNPSSTKSIFIKEIHLSKTTAGAADLPRLRRSSARGTASTSYTLDITNHADHAAAPASGMIQDLAFSVQPTFAGTANRGLIGMLLPGAIGAAVMWIFEVPIQVKAGNGLAIVTGSALAFPVSEAVFVIDE
jgi:hypothetical protein